MPVVKELLRTEPDGSISFGNYEAEEKQKLADFPHEGDLLKVKTWREITRLESNEMFVYESVPGTAVNAFLQTEDGVRFSVEGESDAMITVGALEESALYRVSLDGEDAGEVKTNLGGKLNFSVSLQPGKAVRVEITRG